MERSQARRKSDRSLPKSRRTRSLYQQCLEQYGSVGRTEEAIAAYDGAVAADPTNYEAWDNQGYAYVLLEKYAEALVSIEQSIVINPKHANGQYDKACCFAY